METKEAIKIAVDELFEAVIPSVKIWLTDFLLEKNKAYGDSAFKPANVFSKLGAVEAINLRMDDKIKRLFTGQEYASEDTELDLMGYIVLKRAVQRYELGKSIGEVFPKEATFEDSPWLPKVKLEK